MDEDVKAKATSGAVACGAASVVARRANRNRKGLLLTNDSDTVIYLTFGGLAVANSGLRLNAGGGVFEINATNLYKGIISAISAGADKALLYVEIE